MKRLLKYTALIATVLVISSSAWALDYTDHINTAPNNKGDMMIFPWFLALDGGWQTKLTVINTDQVNSVVAKVVFRSFKNSQEMLDFLIYLSPADVWTGKISVDTTTKAVKVFSDDDSILVDLKPTFAIPGTSTAVNQPLFTTTLCSDDGSFLGYVEVIESAWGEIAPGAPGVKKTDIYKVYSSDTMIDADLGTLTTGGINVLAGFMDFGNTINGMTATYQATTFRDYKNTDKQTTGIETKIGVGAMNNLAEIEASFTKNNIGLPYVNNVNDVALHFMTFPTKQSDASDCKDVTSASPYFHDNAEAGDTTVCIPYSLTTFDLTEKFPSNEGSPFSGGPGITTNTFCNEVNFVATSPFAYPEGWGYYVLAEGTTTTDSAQVPEPLFYNGAPVIPTYLFLGTSGLTGGYGTWTNSAVATTPPVPPLTVPLPANILVDYQYTDLLAP